MMTNRHSRQKGFTLLASGFCAVALVAAAGLALDIGRMYITKNEAQSYADAAAVSAALKLNGTAGGLTAADAAVAASPNSWNFGTTVFSGTVTEYSADGLNNWLTSGSANAATVAYARVTATVSNLPLYLLPVLNGFGGNISNLSTVKAVAVAGQVVRSPTVFPYSPVAHAINCGTAGLPAGMDLGVTCDATGNFGYQIGRDYDLKWPTSQSPGTLGDGQVPCDGDNQWQWINGLNGTKGNTILGGISISEFAGVSASSISNQIQDDQRTTTITIGAALNVASGDKNSIASDFNARAALDNTRLITFQTPLSDIYGTGANLASPDGKVDIHDNTTYHTYETDSGYTGRRIINVVVRSGFGQETGATQAAAVDLPAAQQNIAVGFAQFLLLPDYGNGGGGNSPWCATYIGSDALYGANHGGVNGGGVGVSYVRLTQ